MHLVHLHSLHTLLIPRLYHLDLCNLRVHHIAESTMTEITSTSVLTLEQRKHDSRCH